MKELPILFSAPMVRAILDGRKTQTRRIVKPQPDCPVMDRWFDVSEPGLIRALCGDVGWRCPYGVPGDRLWVRETWADVTRAAELSGSAVYRADGDADNRSRLMTCVDGSTMGVTVQRWKPAIHMPRWASRITLEVTGVRVERLQEIDAGDCAAEGIAPRPCDCEVCMRAPIYCPAVETGLISDYASLWDSINGNRAPWASNPWVWVVEFRRVERKQTK